MDQNAYQGKYLERDLNSVFIPLVGACIESMIKIPKEISRKRSEISPHPLGWNMYGEHDIEHNIYPGKYLKRDLKSVFIPLVRACMGMMI